MSLLPNIGVAPRDRALSQFFTPAWLAERVWKWMLLPDCYTIDVLEPSAGDGALIKPLTARRPLVRRLVAYEVDARHCASLVTLRGQGGLPFEIRQRDFLADENPGRFHITVMNPPYEDGQEIAFTEKALGCCDRVGGIFRAAMLFGQKRHAFWRWTDVRRLAFLSERPHFGGEHSAKADFVVLDLVRRTHARLQGEPSATSTEWWLR